MHWTPTAEKSLKAVPFFIRGVVKKGVESMATKCGQTEIDDAFYLKVKSSRGRWWHSFQKKWLQKKLGACSGREAKAIMVEIEFSMHDLPFIALIPILGFIAFR